MYIWWSVWELRRETFIWCTSIENELSKRSAGRKTANRRLGSIPAPVHEHQTSLNNWFLKSKVQWLFIRNNLQNYTKNFSCGRTTERNYRLCLQSRMPSPSFPNLALVPCSAIRWPWGIKTNYTKNIISLILWNINDNDMTIWNILSCKNIHNYFRYFMK